MTDLFQLFAVSAVVMGISQTITKESIFEPLREKLGGKETWFGYLVSCPYCVSHYVAFALVPLTGTYPIQVVVVGGWVGSVLSWFLSAILLTVIAAFFRVLFWFVDEAQGLVRRRQRTEEEEIATKRLERKKAERELPSEEHSKPPSPPPH